MKQWAHGRPKLHRGVRTEPWVTPGVVEVPRRQKEKQEMASGEGGSSGKEGKVTPNFTLRSGEHPPGDPFRNCGVFSFGEALASLQRAQKEGAIREVLTRFRSPGRHPRW